MFYFLLYHFIRCRKIYSKSQKKITNFFNKSKHLDFSHIYIPTRITLSGWRTDMSCVDWPVFPIQLPIERGRSLEGYLVNHSKQPQFSYWLKPIFLQTTSTLWIRWSIILTSLQPDRVIRVGIYSLLLTR